MSWMIYFFCITFLLKGIWLEPPKESGDRKGKAGGIGKNLDKIRGAAMELAFGYVPRNLECKPCETERA